MPPVSTEDYLSLLQKITVMEMKIQRLEVNVEVNGLYGNETTLPLSQNSRDEQANTQLKSAVTMTKKEDNKSLSDNPPWNRSGAKPKDKSCFLEAGRRITGRAHRAEICNETDWPSLPRRQRNASTPVDERKQDWTTVRGKVSSKPPEQLSVKLQNRFTPLTENPGSDNHPSERSRVRTEHPSQRKRPARELKAGPETVIVGDSVVKDLHRLCSKNTKVLCYPKDMVSDIQERIPKILAEFPTARNIVLHTGTNDVSKQQSEVLKRDFTGLLNTVSSLNAAVFVSGPIPPVRGGEVNFSRLLALNKWLSSACADHSVHFINNFNIFWERRHLFKTDGFNFNKSGAKLFASNLFYCLHHPSARGAKAVINMELSQRGDQTKPSEDLEEQPPRSPSSPSLSPSSPHLQFTEQMMERVNAGLRSTPRPNPSLGPNLFGSPTHLLTENPKSRPPASPPLQQLELRHLAVTPV